MYTSRTFLYILQEIYWAALQNKQLKSFQALNDLKCSTVGNLGSQWALVIMLLGFTHFFGEQSQQEAQLMQTNPRHAFRGQSKSPNIVSFHILGISPIVQ